MPAKLLLYWDGVSWGSCSMSREGPGRCCSPFWRAHHYGPPSPHHAAESRALNMCLEEGSLGLVIGMGVGFSMLQRGNAALHS